jgi:hypothetical protein
MADLKPDLKIILREADIPFFSDDDLDFYARQNKNDLNATAYHCLIVKSEENKMNLSGLDLPETSNYFRRLARRYRPRHSGVLGG